MTESRVFLNGNPPGIYKIAAKDFISYKKNIHFNHYNNFITPKIISKGDTYFDFDNNNYNLLLLVFRWRLVILG